MKKAKLFYNPFSGNASFKLKLDACIRIMQKGGYEVHPFRSTEMGDIPEHIMEMDKDYYDIIIVSGGDGSINIVLNAMMKADINIPIGIIPSGTANDFATYLGLPKEPEEAIKVILKDRIMDIDVGLVNDKYFINVCCVGLWANVSTEINSEFKNALGKMAYYVKGIEQLQNFTPFLARITTETEVIEGKIYMMLALNSSGTGGFEKIVSNASVTDGLFDFLVVKEMPFVDLTKLLMQWFRGDVLEHSRVTLIRDRKLKIEMLEKEDEKNVKMLPLLTDMDGEKGPALPVEIAVADKKVKIFVP